MVIWLLTLINVLGPRVAGKFGGWTLALGVLPVAAVGLLTVARPSLEAVAPDLYADGEPALAGMQAAPPTRTAGLAGVWDGSAQRAADAWTSG